MRTEATQHSTGTSTLTAREHQGPRQKGFANLVSQAMGSLAHLQAEADRVAESVATGDLSKLQEAVIAMQEASLAVDLVVAVRNHLVEGVQELLRTQV